MINIAVCDGSRTITNHLENLIASASQNLSINVNCNVFSDSVSLLKNIRIGNMYDLIFLDTEMPGMNGIETAKVLRTMGLSVLIIYMSSHENHIKDLIATEPIYFLSKPIEVSEFAYAFAFAVKRLTEKPHDFTFMYKKEYFKLPLNDIQYFESSNRLIYIHTSNNSAVFYGKLNDIEDKLALTERHFLRVHQSYLVNFDYIYTLNYQNVILLDGQTLPISHEKRKTAIEQFKKLCKCGV